MEIKTFLRLAAIGVPLAFSFGCTGDGDGDGYASPSPGDCDDGDPDTHPDAAEVCDGKDNDCDGRADEGLTATYYYDSDGDGYGDSGETFPACTMPLGYADVAGDCDDDNPTVNPGAEEVCDGEDTNCDGVEDPPSCPSSECLSSYADLADLVVPYTEPGTILVDNKVFDGQLNELDVEAGDTIFIDPGAYPPGLVIDQPRVTVVCTDAWITGSGSDSGIWISADSVTIDGCNVVGVTSNNSGGAGVKVSLSGSETLSVSLSNMIIAHNTVYGKHGGGVYCNDCTVDLQHVTVAHNRVGSGGYKGAGVYLNSQDIESVVTMTGGAVVYNGDTSRGNGVALRGDGSSVPQRIQMDSVCVGGNAPHQLLSHGNSGPNWTVESEGLMSLDCGSHDAACTPTFQ